MAAFLDQYDSLDVIGNGSFGIIRKVRRKSDGLIFARKELNFERMTERDRKQIVAEVNILKDLNHEHIVRYHDRYVDRDAGILYILMEYCGGGDLSTVIKQATRQNRPVPEDTIWNYFMQILLALNHCHHPSGHGRTSSSGSAGGYDSDCKERRNQVLHRDLKPDNVFLDDFNRVKLGDFGLSKALVQASFANTYVGTPYYMSPELMQEKAYDSKSDIWSLGCLIYELCALKPPFHEAKTHAELNVFIRNGRIPPLPKGYSQALQAVVKAMLNLNPAMRPSTAQLLQHERLELVFKVSETEKMLTTVKNHKATILARERELVARESSLAEREQQVSALLTEKDQEISTLKQYIENLQARGSQVHSNFTQQDMEVAVQTAVNKREDELRIAVSRREEEVAAAIARREEDLAEAMRRRETEIFEQWQVRETEIRREYEEKMKDSDERANWIMASQEQLRKEEERLESLRFQLDNQAKQLSSGFKGRLGKNPLDEVKNLIGAKVSSPVIHPPTPKPISSRQNFATPVSRSLQDRDVEVPSAMKGVILTATGETLATPAPGDISSLLTNSPKVGLHFADIFDKHDGDVSDECPDTTDEENEEDEGSPPPSPRSKRETEILERCKKEDPGPNGEIQPPTRIRRPSIRSSSTSSAPSPSTNRPAKLGISSRPPSMKRACTVPVAQQSPAEYDRADEDNLPSPFLKRADRERVTTSVGTTTTSAGRRMKRPSNGNMLRAMAAANSAAAVSRKSSVSQASNNGDSNERTRASVVKKTVDDGRKRI